MRPAMLDGSWDEALRASPYWLRFELGGELLSNTDQAVPRFLQAFHRAQTVANALFSSTASLTAILAASPEAHRDFIAPTADVFSTLRSLGFRAPAPWCQWSASFGPRDGEGLPLHWQALDINDPAMRDVLLWVSIAYGMPISPKVPVVSFMTDFEAGVMLHVYDDRGMDVRALDRDAIEPLYRRFDHWLLDYDRPRMAAAFEQG